MSTRKAKSDYQADFINDLSENYFSEEEWAKISPLFDTIEMLTTSYDQFMPEFSPGSDFHYISLPILKALVKKLGFSFKEEDVIPILNEAEDYAIIMRGIGDFEKELPEEENPEIHRICKMSERNRMLFAKHILKLDFDTIASKQVEQTPVKLDNNLKMIP